MLGEVSRSRVTRVYHIIRVACTKCGASEGRKADVRLICEARLWDSGTHKPQALCRRFSFDLIHLRRTRQCRSRGCTTYLARVMSNHCLACSGFAFSGATVTIALQARLLAAFCPVLWFDASEKHFPVSVETFISSALLLRKERSPGELRQQQQEQQQQQQQHQEDKTLHDRGSLRQAFAVSSRDILSSNGSSFCSQTDGDDGCNGDATDPLTASSDIADPLERREHAPGQRCGECGKGKGWRVPLKKGWSVVPLPVGSKNWSTETLLEQQRVSGVRCVFRCA